MSILPSKATTDYTEVTTALNSLTAKGIINTPTHWQTVATTLDYLPDLLCALGGAN